MNTQTNLPDGITVEMVEAVKSALTSFDLSCVYCVDAIKSGFYHFPDHNPSVSHHRKHCTCGSCW